MIAAKIIPEEVARRSANLLNDKEQFKIPCVTDISLRDKEDSTLISQYLSPPRCLRLVESEAAEDLRDDVERGLREEKLSDRFLNGRNEPTAPHIMVPGRPPSEGVDHSHTMRRDITMLEPLILCP